MISKETYLEMKRLILEFETEPKSLNKTELKESPYLTETKVEVITNHSYNPLFVDNKICTCGHSYYRHFDSYEQMAPIGCKYCECYTFIETTESEENNLPKINY